MTDDLRRLAEAATPGPWRESLDESYSHILSPDGADLAHVGIKRADAHFIVAARNALPALLDERDELREAGNVAYESMIERGHQINALRADLAAANARADQWHKAALSAGRVADELEAKNAALRERITELEEITASVPTKQSRIKDLEAHILDIDAHATPFGDIPDDLGYVGQYLVTAGSLHRALGKIGHTASSCEAEAERDRLAARIDKALAVLTIHDDDPNAEHFVSKETKGVIMSVRAALSDTAGPEPLKVGLCGNRDDHDPHEHHSESLGTFWCSADQSTRLPYAAERRRTAGPEGDV